MAGKTFIGVNGKAKKVKAIYIGVNGKAKKVKAAYVGVNGKAKKIWPINEIPDDRYMSLTSIGTLGSARLQFKIPLDASFVPYPLMRCVIKFNISDTSGAIANTEQGYRYINNMAFVEYGYLWVNEAYGTVAIRLGYQKSGSGSQVYKLFNVTHSKRKENYSEDNPFTSYTAEDMITNNIYTIDFLNNYNIYIDSQKGYYSNSANRLMGTFDKTKLSSPINDMYSANWIGTGVYFGIPYGLNGKLYSVKFYKNNTTLVKDYIPAYRISDNYIGMYDMVNKTFLEAIVINNKKPLKTDTDYYICEE